MFSSAILVNLNIVQPEEPYLVERNDCIACSGTIVEGSCNSQFSSPNCKSWYIEITLC